MDKENSKKSYTVGSLFAGVGGICLGFQQAGFDVLWANEWDSKACETYRKNFKHKLYEGDIHDVDAKKVPKVDVITSGFPCQAFSIAGYRKGFHDERGDLFFETMRFINEVKPKAFLLENVKNLASHDKGNTIKVIEEFVKMGSKYSYLPIVLNSMSYGNVPQNRERIYIVGFRGEADYWGDMDYDNICTKVFNFPKPIKQVRTIKDIIENKKVDEKYYYERYSGINKSMYDMLCGQMTNPNSVYQWRRIYVRENKSGVCPTLTANMGTGGHNVPLIKDGTGIRKFTPRECARLQGFPDSFILTKDMADSHLYKQMGNSVTVPVIRRIAEQIRIALDAKYKGISLKEKNMEKIRV
ncbi:MAG: DNA cytosine methyltransferase [Candidatus Omnitrophica bacterium]|nr:DNA cytosine methyltransferase [Candidatus Omnitrophota bacterium]